MIFTNRLTETEHFAKLAGESQVVSGGLLVSGIFCGDYSKIVSYLDPTFCRGISSLAETPEESLTPCQEKLRHDVETEFGKTVTEKFLIKLNTTAGISF